MIFIIFILLNDLSTVAVPAGNVNIVLMFADNEEVTRIA